MPQVVQAMGSADAGRLVRRPLVALLRDQSAAVRAAVLLGLGTTLRAVAAMEERHRCALAGSVWGGWPGGGGGGVKAQGLRRVQVSPRPAPSRCICPAEMPSDVPSDVPRAPLTPLSPPTPRLAGTHPHPRCSRPSPLPSYPPPLGPRPAGTHPPWRCSRPCCSSPPTCPATGAPSAPWPRPPRPSQQCSAPTPRTSSGCRCC
jgi:hypothetical protein